MPTFKYVATDPAGNRQTGVMNAVSAIRVRNDLMNRDLQPVEVKLRRKFTQIEITKKKVKPADLMNFSRQLAAFLRAGIPILDALEALSVDMDSAVLKQVVIDMADALRAGSTLSDAMAQHAGLFPSYYVGILRSAELTGNLDTVLDQLALYIERDVEAKRAIKSALTYPIVIMFMAMITVVVLVVYVLPKFETFFQSFDAKLPLPTRVLLGFSRFLTAWWMVIGAILIVLVGLGVSYFRTRRGRLTRDKMMLGFPVVGDVVRYSVVERFCRILGSMLRAGVPVPDALAAASEGTNNLVFEEKLAQANAAVLRGEGLSEPLAETHLFPGAAQQMLRVGEESGTLDRQLDLAADFYQGELEYKLKRLTSLFEPTVIVVMGLIVGFVAVALVSAMYGIFNQVNLQ